MATYYGRFEDAQGNVYCATVEASDVEMSDGSTAASAISDLNALGTNLNTRLTAMNADFNAILDTSS